MDKEPRYFLRTFGGLSLHEGDPRTPPLASGIKPLLLLAILLDRRGHTAQRKHLAQLLWPSSSKARASLRTAIHALNRLAPSLLVVDDETVGLRVDRLTSDLSRFRLAVAHNFQREIVGLAAGPFLDIVVEKGGWEIRQWSDGIGREVEAAVLAAYQALIDECVRTGAYREAVTHAHALYDRDPLNEQTVERLVQTLDAAGDKLGAVQAFEKYDQLITSETGDRPPEHLSDLVAGLRKQLDMEGAWMEGTPPEGSRGEAAVGSATSDLRLRVASAAGVALIAGVAGFVLARDTTTVPAPLLDSGDYHLTALVATDSGQAYADIWRRQHRWRVVPRPLPYLRQALSPDQQLLAAQEDSETGYDLVVYSYPNGDEVFRLSDEPDDTPNGWSPDGRQLLFARSQSLGSTAVWHLMSAMADGSGVRSLMEWDGTAIHGSWSPRGDRIAAQAMWEQGEGQVVILNTDGEIERVHQFDDPITSAVAWDPLGTRIAMTVGRDPQVLYLTDPGGSAPRPEPLPFSVYSPVWLSQRQLAMVRRDTPENTLWIYDLGTGALTQVTVDAEVDWLHAPTSWNLQESWPDSILVGGVPDVLSPGTYLKPTARAVTRDQIAANLEANAPKVWVVGPSRQVSDDGWWVVEGTGPLTVVAAIPGWRRTTVQTVSQQAEARPLDVQFFEDWSGGLDTTRWVTHGNPSPQVDPQGGPQRIGSLMPNGDDSYGSGAVSVEAFHLKDGLTIEVPVLSPRGRDAFEGFAIGFLQGRLPPRDSVASAWTNTSRAVVMGPMEGGGLTCTPGCDAPRGGFPTPADLGSWHRYGLQLSATGDMSVVVDGTILYTTRIPDASLLDLSEPFHLQLDGQSLSGTLAMGPVTVYRGLKWGVPKTS